MNTNPVFLCRQVATRTSNDFACTFPQLGVASYLLVICYALVALFFIYLLVDIARRKRSFVVVHRNYIVVSYFLIVVMLTVQCWNTLLFMWN